MGFMEFVDEEKIVNLNTVSKSFLKSFEECKLKAWFEKREGKKESKVSESFKLVRYLRDLFSAEIASAQGENFKVSSRGLKPATKYEGDMLIKRMNPASIIGDGEIFSYDTMESTLLRNGVNLIGSINLMVMRKDPKYGSYMHVFLLKTGFRAVKEVDTEALLYTFIVAKKYKMPVLFTRYSARSGDEWGQFFSLEDALALEDGLTTYTTEVKDTIESEEKPELCASGLCVQCPFINKCPAKDLEELNLSDLVNKYQRSLAQSKVLKEKIQTFVGDREEPLETNGFSIGMKSSVSKAVKTKGIKKQDLLAMFAKAGKMNLILDSVELKLTDNLIMRAKEEFGIDFKDVSRRVLAIELAGNEEDSNEEE